MGKRILVIDDDQKILEAINDVLSYEDYTVKTIESPAEIDTEILNFAPHLILLDINLGDFNGLQVCRKLKSMSITRSIPVVMLSADDSIFEAIQIFGADDIVLKPVDMNNLLEIVGKYLLAPVIPFNRNFSAN